MNNDKTAVMIDSGCDVPKEVRDKLDIYILPLRVIYPEKDYADDIDIDPQMVYRRFPKEFPKTSTPSMAEVQDLFERIHGDGYEKVIAVCISSAFSGTFNTIRLQAAQQDALEVYCFDTKNISVAAGLLAIWAARQLQKGKTFSEVTAGLEKKIGDSKVFFYMDTLTYLRHGGRIGSVSNMVGNALHLKPIISCNEEGTYYTVGLIRGAKQGKKKLLTEALKFCNGHRVWVIVGHGDAESEAQQLRSLFEEQLSDKKVLFVRQITATMAINTGPGLLGFGILREP